MRYLQRHFFQKKGKMSTIKFSKSRKGDIPTFILVAGVFLVCAVTIISIVVSSASFERSFDVLQSMSNANSIAEQVRFYENAGLNPINFLDIKKNDSLYNITIEQKEGEKRTIYIQYLIPATASNP